MLTRLASPAMKNITTKQREIKSKSCKFSVELVQETNQELVCIVLASGRKSQPVRIQKSEKE
jgi:hypothetical protein